MTRGGKGGKRGNETNLDAGRFVQLVRFHVHDVTRLAVDTPRMLSVRMLRLSKTKRRLVGEKRKRKRKTHAERREGADDVPTRVLHERAGDDLEGIRDGAEGARLDARDRARARVQADRDGHLDRAAAGHERRVEDDVARDGHGVCQVAVDLVQDVLGWTAEEDGARLGCRAFGQEGEVSVEMGGGALLA